MPWKYLATEPGPDLKLFKARFDTLINPRNQALAKVVVLESEDSVNVVAITPDKNVVVIRQFRFGIGKTTIELPGGLAEPDEDPLDAAKRELREETGYSGTKWTALGSIQNNPVYMNSSLHHFLLEDARKTDTPELDEEEDIQVETLSPQALVQLVDTGEIQHPHVISALARIFPLWDRSDFKISLSE